MVSTYRRALDMNIDFYSKHSHFLNYILMFSDYYEIQTAHLGTVLSGG